MINSRFNIPIYSPASVLKSRWIWVIAIIMISVQSNAQQGYTWTFATSGIDGNGKNYFSSSPALTGSTGSHPLTVIGGGAFTTGFSANTGLGTSCTSPIPIANYDINTGLEFNNSGSLITNTYTIEITVNQNPAAYRRLVGFYALGGAGTSPQNDYGIYVDPNGNVLFYVGTENVITGSPLLANTWYHLTFTRTSSGLISYYKNGVLIGTYNDSDNQFIPHPGSPSYNLITFLKDNEGDDPGGKIARISLYNTALDAASVLQSFNNICSAIPEEGWQTNGNIGTNETHFIGTKNSQPLIFKTNNAEAFRVNTSGQVVIGTDKNPAGYKLAVGGNIIAERVTVKQLASWPDYVFDKKYPLPTLKEIEAYISKNNHLPGIPSAAEVEEKGIDIGDQQALLLKKIEELTLHLININKQVERLTHENDELRKKEQEAGKKVKR